MNFNQSTTHDPALEGLARRDAAITRQPGGFDQLGIVSNLMHAIRKLKFEIPTPIQVKGIPAGIAGQDIIALAQTGSGKTIAFGVPMLQRLSKMKRGTGLVIVPTRELAIQVDESINSLSRAVNLRTTVLIGGASMSMQTANLKKNPRVIIATPGRLMDHIEKKNIDLSQVEILVLDEADRMLDMGFLPDIKKIVKLTPDQRQTLLFSATMTKEIAAIATQMMTDPVSIEVNHSGTTPAEVSHELYVLKNPEKSSILALKIKECEGPVLVFTRTRRMASNLTKRVKKMGFGVAEIHSNRSQGQRQSALDGFRRGNYQVLIATDIAARGIDVTGIELVVNYDLPANPEDYVHRVGRTGRAGKLGHAISFANLEQKAAVNEIERHLKIRMVRTSLPEIPVTDPVIQEPERNDVVSKLSEGDQRPSRKVSGPVVSRRRDDRRTDTDLPMPKRAAASGRGSSHDESTRPDTRGISTGPKRKTVSDDRRQKSDVSRTDRHKSDRRSSNERQSGQSEAERKRSKTKGSSADKKNQPKSDSPFWQNFLKHRPSGKKSTSRGGKPKKRSRRS